MEITRKDKNPKDTISNIKRILHNNNIRIKESKTKNIHNRFFSVRVELKDFYEAGTNGKGEEKMFAKASAYAELMERIASKILINDYFLNKERSEVSINDKYIPVDKMNTKLLNTFFKNSTYSKESIHDDYTLHSSFRNPIKNKDSLLPIKLINYTSLSNGLCSGNTYHEAICQGICEIFERYCYRTILEKELFLNTVIIDNNLPIYNKIKYLENIGYKVIIKDCSLGSYPVIGVLILDKKEEKYIFTLGSDLNINIAIQRCLTEMFQGLNSDKSLINKMKPVDNNYQELSNEEKITNWIKCYTSNNGIHPKTIFKSKKTVNYKSLKAFKQLSTNRENYNYLLKIISKNNLDIYIKDYSYLNFPVYKVFIPNLSNIFVLDEEESYVLFNNHILKDLFFNIEKDFSKAYLKKALKLLKVVINKDKYSIMNVGNYFHSNKYVKTNYNLISFEFLYALTYYKYDNSSKPSKDINNENLKSYLEGIESLNLTSRFNYILNDLKLIVPSCPNCDTCKLKNTCKYKEWLKFKSIYKKETI